MDNPVRLGRIRKMDLDRKYGIITEEESTSGSGGNIVFQLDDETIQLKEGQLVQFVMVDGKATHVVPLLNP